MLTFWLPILTSDVASTAQAKTLVKTSYSISGVRSFSQETSLVKSSNPSSDIHEISLNYPSWLCSKGVPIILKWVPAIDGEGGSVRCFGLEALRFGRPRKEGLVCSLPITGGLLLSPQARSSECVDNGPRIEFSFRSIEFRTGRLETNMHQEFEFRTELLNYSPAIVGRGGPLRIGIYKSTQAPLHAWVMSRFHRHVEIQKRAPVVGK